MEVYKESSNTYTIDVYKGKNSLIRHNREGLKKINTRWVVIKNQANIKTIT
jgi:hypothetical protein